MSFNQMIEQPNPYSTEARQEAADPNDENPAQFCYESIKKNTYKHQLFCWIQQGKTQKVIQFFQKYPCFVNQFTTFNNWSPAMFAVRYGNFKLLNYFVENQHTLDATNIYNNTVVHAACYANNPAMLTYLLKDLGRTPNPLNSDPSPLKFSIKTINPKLLQILACYGAYYIFDEISNNVRKQIVPDKKEQPVYYSLLTKTEVLSSMIVKDTELKEYPIKQSLRWVRAKNFMTVKKGVQNNSNPKTAPLSRIFQNQQYMESILKYCVGTGKFLFVHQSETKDNSHQREKE